MESPVQAGPFPRALTSLREQLTILAADADTQNEWLHPCGWARAEPYEHVRDHPPCMPVDELMQSYDDMWPQWRRSLAPIITTDAVAALDLLAARFQRMRRDDFVDDIETLDNARWHQVRIDAQQALAHLPPATGPAD